MHKVLVCAYKSQDFAKNQKIFARSHDRDTVTFRNYAYKGSQIDYGRTKFGKIYPTSVDKGGGGSP